jgi:hypothetical protein
MSPARDPKYLAWIRTFPCLVCGIGWTEAAHVGPHGLSQKASDHSTVPLCRRHHRAGNDALHKLGRRRFEALHFVDLQKAIRRFNQKPFIRVMQGRFIANIHGEEFALHPVQDGVARSIHAAVKICRQADALVAIGAKS